MVENLNFISIKKIDEKIIEQIRKWRNLPEIKNNMYNNHIINKKEHYEWINKVRKCKDMRGWVVYHGKKPIGFVNLKNIDYKNRITDWGFYIGEKEYRGKGLSKHILYNLMRYVFDELKLRKMYTTVLGNNKLAIKLYKKMGFVKEGSLKKQLIRKGRIIDLYIFSFFLEKWEDKKEKLKQENKIKDYNLK